MEGWFYLQRRTRESISEAHGPAVNLEGRSLRPVSRHFNNWTVIRLIVYLATGDRRHDVIGGGRIIPGLGWEMRHYTL